MLQIEEALRLVLANLPERRIEEIDFPAALGRVLAEDISATGSIPPFNRAAMDGFALRAADVQIAPARLRCIGEIRAGEESSVSVGPGEAVAIMTGAAVPAGADAVQMIELTERSADGGEVVILKPVKAGESIAPIGSEAAAGQIVLQRGRTVGPAEIAVLATFGATRVKVYARPRTALVSTGDELVEPGNVPRAGQIRNSNAYSILSQLRQMGLEPDYLGIARDDKGELHRFIAQGLERDVLILSGGVSMGEYDLVKDVFEELRLEILFTRVAMKPGKPTVFARRGDKLVFGLPGNPVSTFVSFENFVRPAIGTMCGFDRPGLPRIRGCLLHEMKQKPGRTAFLPAWVTRHETTWDIKPLPWKGSGDIIGFSRCNATVIFPGDRDYLARGEQVEAMLLPDFASRASQ